MDTALPQKFPFMLDRNLAKANCTENHVCTSCDTVVLDGSVHGDLKSYLLSATQWPRCCSANPVIPISICLSASISSSGQ